MTGKLWPAPPSNPSPDPQPLRLNQAARSLHPPRRGQNQLILTCFLAHSAPQLGHRARGSCPKRSLLVQPSRVECPRLGSRSQSSLLVLCKPLSVAVDWLGASRTKGTGGYQQAVDWADATWALRFCPRCIPAVRVRPPLTLRASPPNPAKGYGGQSGRRGAGLSPCSDPHESSGLGLPGQDRMQDCA